MADGLARAGGTGHNKASYSSMSKWCQSGWGWWGPGRQWAAGRFRVRMPESDLEVAWWGEKS